MKHKRSRSYPGKRTRLSRRKSRKMFTKGASRVNGKNYGGSPMRGGIRL